MFVTFFKLICLFSPFPLNIAICWVYVEQNCQHENEGKKSLYRIHKHSAGSVCLQRHMWIKCITVKMNWSQAHTLSSLVY